ncbi:MAG TPA: 50S ribosomal protein L24 [Firmicutes bacterium]|nr:50S ribosomal protein L24 [Bacillota bacterium]
MAVKVHVKKGDRVYVLSGKDKGKSGTILRVLPKENRVVVEGINIVKKHTRPTRTNTQGGIIESPAPINASKVMLICRHCNKPTRVRRERGEKGVRRICKRCEEAID